MGHKFPCSSSVPDSPFSPVVGFIIGLIIILISSLLNAGEKLRPRCNCRQCSNSLIRWPKFDKAGSCSSSGPRPPRLVVRGITNAPVPQIRTSALPKASRRKDFLRPLWVLGMVRRSVVPLTVGRSAYSTGVIHVRTIYYRLN